MVEENEWLEAGLPPEGSLLFGEAQAPGSCGEFVQGTLSGVDFLVSCPIDLFSRAQVWLRPASKDSGLTREPNLHWLAPRPAGRGNKVFQALRKVLAHLQAPVDAAWVRLESAIPPAKGMGSSTADIVAVMTAAAVALGEVLTPWDKARLAISIEPSDSIMFPNLARLDHRRAHSVRLMGPPPDLRVAVVDLGGEVNTQDFNRREDLEQANAAKESELRRALICLRDGIKQSDPAKAGEAATISAQAHQAILPKPHLEELIALAPELQAVGVCVAHSGTVAGLLFDGRDQPSADLGSGYWPLSARWHYLGSYRVIPGGTRLARGGMTFGGRTSSGARS